MKRLMAFTLLTILLASCSEVDERPLPPQMKCAQREMYEHHDGIFALYLLSELEDSIDEMPDYIQTRYRLMKSEAEKTKLIRPAYQYQSDDLYHALRQRDSLFTQQISEEREAFELQSQKYQESLCQIHLLQWLGAVAILGVVVALYLLWLRRGRKKNDGADKIGTPIWQPAFSDIILRLGRLADKGEQPACQALCPNLRPALQQRGAVHGVGEGIAGAPFSSYLSCTGRTAMPGRRSVVPRWVPWFFSWCQR